MFEITYTPRYGDYKDFETIKPGSILDMVQDISILHSSTLGYGLTGLRDMKIAWLMQGIKVNFITPVKTGIPIKIFTDVCSMKGASSERGCIITQNGEVVARTVANWFTFDTENQRPCRIPRELAETYPIHNFNDDFYAYKKPEIINDSEYKYTIRVGNKDLDTNMHLNNQKSAEMLLDVLPFDFNIKYMTLFYKNPAFLGDELKVYTKKIENGYYIHLLKSSGEICVAGHFTDT